MFLRLLDIHPCCCHFLLLLQFLYTALLVLVFALVSRRAEKKRHDQTRRHIAELNDLIDEFRQSHHDFKKHISYLHKLVVTQGTDNEPLVQQVTAYCDGLFDRVEQDDILLHLDDPVLRALLYGRKVQAKAETIDFELTATTLLPAFPLKEYELVEIFDNLMDNAMECVREMTHDRRITVELQGETDDDGHERQMLRVSNPYDTLDFSAVADGKAYTSKGGEHKGLGLKKVSRIVRDNGGELTLSNEGGEFTVTVQFG